ncbi:Uncharacterised protein [Achromobacter aegrifaciens]|uniref:Uncharacterized protein n=1 Tax=Achromobacter aegrifaciens TaxID=1287736 RepID=A0AAD2IXP7_ACHAE|nr:Uncharacterised protein [Achromobacter aegrifaciens]
MILDSANGELNTVIAQRLRLTTVSAEKGVVPRLDTWRCPP